ncbi:GNAT family N-acetyltransferase [Teredinibacter turnerae]|uniref:GNAT family N-acetyltransferase n=1 Tax=Teredinibacter turnerae TaxID=2426 RepID=UPI0012FAA547
MPAYNGMGSATEAARAVLAAEMARCNLNRVWAVTSQTNSRSIRLLQKTGFLSKGTTEALGSTDCLFEFFL